MVLDIYSGGYNIVYNHNNKDLSIPGFLTHLDKLQIDNFLKKLKNEVVVLGDKYDCYPSVELENNITRYTLSLIEQYKLGLCLYVRNDLFLRDLDIIKAINKYTSVYIILHIPSITEDIEMLSCMSKECISNVFKVLNEEHIKTGISLNPTLPFINDDINNFKEIIDFVSLYSPSFLMYYGDGVIVSAKNKMNVYNYLDKYYPAISSKYESKRSESYVITSGKDATRYIKEISEYYKINSNLEDIYKKINKYEKKIVQLGLFD